MLKKSLFLFCAMSFAVSTLFAAPDRVGKTDVGLHFAGAFGSDTGVDSGTFVGASVSHTYSDWQAFGVTVGGHQADLSNVTNGSVTINGPEISELSLFADFIFRAKMSENTPFSPYGVVGLGFLIWDVDDATSNVSGATIRTDVDTAFGFKLGAGLDWFINEHWILNAETAYVFNTADATLSAEGSGVTTVFTETIDLSFWTFGGGLKYEF